MRTGRWKVFESRLQTHETKGPHSDSKKRVSIGQAAHITAASKGGPRYNPNMTSEQRRDIENGIWLCDSCAKMIDSDENQYPVELLKMWKSMAEYALDLGIELCDEINGYCSLLKFVYQSDNCGLYNNYWICFFEMLSENINSLVNCKKTIDSLLHQRYSV